MFLLFVIFLNNRKIAARDEWCKAADIKFRLTIFINGYHKLR